MSDENNHWCRTTRGETTEATFTWTIEDFESRPEKKGEPIFSSGFLVKESTKRESKWKIKLYPKGRKEQENKLSIFLLNDNDFSMKAKYSVSILDSSLKKTNTWTSETRLFVGGFTWGEAGWLLSESIINNPELLTEGHLTIYCELTVYGTDETKTSSGSRDVEIKSGTSAKGLEQVSQHLGKLFNIKEFSDVEIECEGEIFNCHINILSTRSDVFRAMFQADMAENRTKKVIIQDIDSDVASEMLHFIYTGGANENVLKEKSGELLAAANKYQLDVLKSICEDYLCSNLQINNAVENLVFGDLYQASKLRRVAMKVIARNLVKVVKTEEYRNLVKHHPSLAAEIPMALVEDKIK